LVVIVYRERKLCERIEVVGHALSWRAAKRAVEESGYNMVPTNQDPYAIGPQRDKPLEEIATGLYWTGGLLVCQDRNKPFEGKDIEDHRGNFVFDKNGIPPKAIGRSEVVLYVGVDAIDRIDRWKSGIRIFANPQKVKVRYLPRPNCYSRLEGEVDQETGLPQTISKEGFSSLRPEQRSTIPWPFGKNIVRPIARCFPVRRLGCVDDLHSRFVLHDAYSLRVMPPETTNMAAARVEREIEVETLFVNCNSAYLDAVVRAARVSLTPLANALPSSWSIERVNRELRDFGLLFQILELRKGTELFRLDSIDLQILLAAVRANMGRLGRPIDRPLEWLNYPADHFFEPLRELVNLLEPRII